MAIRDLGCLSGLPDDRASDHAASPEATWVSISEGAAEVDAQYGKDSIYLPADLLRVADLLFSFHERGLENDPGTFQYDRCRRRAAGVSLGSICRPSCPHRDDWILAVG